MEKVKQIWKLTMSISTYLYRGIQLKKHGLLNHDVLRHRIGITYEAEAENITSEDIINKIVNEIEVP